MPQGKKIRLQKLIAQRTNLSRRAAEEAIKRGEVAVDGVVITKMGTVVDPDVNKVSYRGHTLRLSEEFTYLVLYKPRNVIVTKSDPQGRPTIWDYLPKWKDTLNSVGRLDFDSEGLILLTNDGELINQLTHPSHEVVKFYEAKVKGEPKTEAIEKLRRGVKLDDGITAPAHVRCINTTGDVSWLEIGIIEGRNRQVRRMCEAVGHPVIKLKRIAVGPIKIGDMKPGESRFLTKREIDQIKNI